MPFSPLPATFLADLQRSGHRGVLELGSGDGGFTALLRRRGVVPVTIDRRDGLAGARATIRADALRPPLRGVFGLVVAANLLRHLWPAVRRHGPAAWRALVARDGCLWILEDEPCLRPPAARNYRDLQDLLARLLPGDRAPLLGLDAFRKRRDAWSWPGRWQDGAGENRWPLDERRVLAMLTGGPVRSDGEVARLVERIGREGIACGRCWWARWRPEEAA